MLGISQPNAVNPCLHGFTGLASFRVGPGLSAGGKPEDGPDRHRQRAVHELNAYDVAEEHARLRCIRRRKWAAAGISDSGISGFFYAARAGC